MCLLDAEIALLERGVCCRDSRFSANGYRRVRLYCSFASPVFASGDFSTSAVERLVMASRIDDYGDEGGLPSIAATADTAFLRWRLNRVSQPSLSLNNTTLSQQQNYISIRNIAFSTIPKTLLSSSIFSFKL